MSADPIDFPIAARQMVRPPTPILPATTMVLRVRQMHSGRWCLERYSGRPDTWFALDHYMDREHAFREAQLRRTRDGVTLLCSECNGVVGDDLAMTCGGCGVQWYPLTLKGPRYEPRTEGLDAYVVAIIILTAALAAIIFFPAGAR